MNLNDLVRGGRYYSPDEPPTAPPVQPTYDPIPEDFEPFEAPKTEEPPAYVAALMQEIQDLKAQVAKPEDPSWKYDNEALAKRQEDQFRQLEQRMAQSIAQVTRPAVVESVVGRVCKGLNEKAQDYVRNQLAGLDPNSLSALSAHPTSLQMLRDAAETAHRRAAVTTPEPIGNPRPGASDTLTSEEERHAQMMFQQFSQSVEGYTLDMARDAVRRAKAAKEG